MARLSRHRAWVRDRLLTWWRNNRGGYPSEWAAVCSIAEKFGVTGATLRLRRPAADPGIGSRARSVSGH
jgi:hypothetical protein